MNNEERNIRIDLVDNNEIDSTIFKSGVLIRFDEGNISDISIIPSSVLIDFGRIFPVDMTSHSILNS